MDEPVVTWIGLGKAGKFPVSPIKVSAVDDDATDGSTVTTDVFGSGVDHNISPPFKGAIQVRGEGRVIDDEGNASMPGDGGDLLERKNVEPWIAHTLPVDELGVAAEGILVRFGVVSVDERDLNPEFGKGVVKEIVGAPVELRYRDHVITGLAEIEDGIGDGSLPARVSESATPAFESGDPGLQNIVSRIVEAGINVAQLFQPEEVGGVFGIPEDKAGGLVDRQGAGPVDGIRHLASMKGTGSESEGVLCICHTSSANEATRFAN